MTNTTKRSKIRETIATLCVIATMILITAGTIAAGAYVGRHHLISETLIGYSLVGIFLLIISMYQYKEETIRDERQNRKAPPIQW